MKVVILRHFQKDLRKLRSVKLEQQILQLIEVLEQTDSLSHITNFKKLTGYENYYRIRVGNYRLGCFIQDDTIEFMRITHRKDIYSIFP